MKDCVLDASVVLKWYLPDEHGSDQAISLLTGMIEGNLNFHSPDLIDYEFINAMWVAGKLGRVSVEDRDNAVKNFLSVDISRVRITKLHEAILKYATEYDRSCYDSAYLALSEIIGVPFITSDKRLYNAVKGKLSSIIWIEDI